MGCVRSDVLLDDCILKTWHKSRATAGTFILNLLYNCRYKQGSGIIGGEYNSDGCIDLTTHWSTLQKVSFLLNVKFSIFYIMPKSLIVIEFYVWKRYPILDKYLKFPFLEDRCYCRVLHETTIISTCET